MIREILGKELLVNLLSLRFMIGLVVAMLLMGLVGYVLMADYSARYQTYLGDLQRHQNELSQTRVFSKVQVILDIPPSPLSVFSRGMRDLPSSITISPYHIPTLVDDAGSSETIHLSGTDKNPVNPLLKVFGSLDVCFVISVVLSLFALLLVFDSLSGEREAGTLKLVFSAPAGRVNLLLGKFLGAVITMAIPLTIGFLEVLILFASSQQVSLRGPDWAGLGLIYSFSLLYLAGFLALGLLVSLFTRESSSGLMASLLAWAVVVIVLPSGLGSLARYYYPERREEAMLEELDRRFSDEFNRIPYRQVSSWNMAQTDPHRGESLLGITREEAFNRSEYVKKAFPLKFRYAEDRYRIAQAYADRLATWRRTRDNLIRPSLSFLYGKICSAVSGTDLETYDAALTRARLYRDALQSYLLPKVARPEWFTRIFEYPDMEPTQANEQAWRALEEKEGSDVYLKKIWTWSRVAPLDLAGMPLMQDNRPGLWARTEGSFWDVVILLGMTGCFLVLALRRILHYPVD